MTTSHVTGAGLGTVVSILVLKLTGWQLSDTDALAVGGAALSLGAGLGHIVGSVGLFGAFRLLLHGSKS